MSQDKDNNEAASALKAAIKNMRCDVNRCCMVGANAEIGYKQGYRDACRAAAELVAASASQSSTPVPRVGGITNNDSSGDGCATATNTNQPSEGAANTNKGGE